MSKQIEVVIATALMVASDVTFASASSSAVQPLVSLGESASSLSSFILYVTVFFALTTLGRGIFLVYSCITASQALSVQSIANVTAGFLIIGVCLAITPSNPDDHRKSEDETVMVEKVSKSDSSGWGSDAATEIPDDKRSNPELAHKDGSQVAWGD